METKTKKNMPSSKNGIKIFLVTWCTYPIVITVKAGATLSP